MIYLVIEAFVRSLLLRDKLTLTDEALHTRLLRSMRLARTDLRYATLDGYGGVHVVTAADGSERVLEFVQRPGWSHRTS